jgi:hypothetical protein
MIIQMPRRRLQFSLLGLFVLTTVIAGALGWWYSRPPQFIGTTSSSTYEFVDPIVSPRTAVSCAMYKWTVATPHDERRLECKVLVIVPSPLGASFASGDRPGKVGWQRDFGAEVHVLEMLDFDVTLRTYPNLKSPGFLGWYDVPEGFRSILAADLRLTYDVLANTVTLGDQTFPASNDSIYVVHVNEQWQSRLSVTDARFDVPNVPESILDKVRGHH